MYNFHTSTLRLLLQRAANVNAKTQTGKTPLMIAAASGNSDAVKLFLQHHAKVNLRDLDGHTALSQANTTNWAKVLRMLKAARAKK